MTDQIEYQAQWSTYEEYGALTIYLREDGSRYGIREGSCVFLSPSQYRDGPEELTEDQAIELILEWDAVEEENGLFWDRNGGL
jgi:hypothetical protein